MRRHLPDLCWCRVVAMYHGHCRPLFVRIYKSSSTEADERSERKFASRIKDKPIYLLILTAKPGGKSQGRWNVHTMDLVLCNSDCENLPATFWEPLDNHPVCPAMKSNRNHDWFFSTRSSWIGDNFFIEVVSLIIRIVVSEHSKIKARVLSAWPRT